MVMEFTVRWSEAKKFSDGNLDIDAEGVYLIGYRKANETTRYPVYIGQGHIGDRLAFHFANSRKICDRVFQKDRIAYYRYAKCSDKQDRLDIELALYHKHGGSGKLCNENEPPGSGRYATIHIEEIFPA